MKLTNGGKFLLVMVVSAALIGMALSDMAVAYHKFIVVPTRVIR